MDPKTYQPRVVNPPTIDGVKKLAEEMKMGIPDEELADYKSVIDELLEGLSIVDTLPEPLPPVKYPRTPGYRPSPQENTHNAWYYKTDIKGAADGKLKDKKLCIKDNIAVAGVPMMNGCKLIEGYMPEFDATVVTRILDAGGHILGKAACEDMCFSGSSITSSKGTIYNPHDKTRSAGGSSDGTAVLVQLGEVDMGLGGDQGGSIRIPSCWTGIVGLKPTWGLVPYTGITSIEPSMDHTGPMARTVKDCALLLEVIAGYDNGLDHRQRPDYKVPEYTSGLTGDLSGVKVGLLKEGFKGCEEDVATVVTSEAKKMASRGATVEEISIPFHEEGEHLWSPVICQGAYITMVKNAGCILGTKDFQQTSLVDHTRRALAAEPNSLSPLMKLVCIYGEYLTRNYGLHFYCKGQNLIRTLKAEYDRLLDTYDVIVMPTLKYKAPKIPPQTIGFKDMVKHCIGMVDNTAPFDATGHPALSINAGFSDGLPVGMMIVGKCYDDHKVLQVAYGYEQIRDAGK